MLRKVLGSLWRAAPSFFRRWSVSLIEPRFTVTTSAVVFDEQGRVLLLKHIFRKGSGWGIPAGFIKKGEQPEEALRRELREEVGLEVESAEIALARTHKKPAQVEIIFRCRPAGSAQPRSVEIKRAEWFDLNSLPEVLGRDQQRLIERILNDGTKPSD
ncbi:MAG TPA: NUDIX domain-containing protein [Pyrinomonadaceae bacterium]|nr:NUDIX domain-containing protein [Pyrinomonadaceae bacterium]